jgi:hypothetical protein
LNRHVYLWDSVWRSPAFNAGILIMNKQEIAEILRKEVGELEISIKKVQARCERLKRFVLDLEEEIAPSRPTQKSIFDGKVRKVIDRVFGEEPKRSKR